MVYLYKIGVTFIFVSAILFSIGLSSYFWPNINAVVIDAKIETGMIDQRHTAVPLSKHTQPEKVYARRAKVTYTYVIGNNKYTNSNISILYNYFLPSINNAIPSSGDIINVNYLPLINSYSILYPGPPTLWVMILVILGVILIKIKTIERWLYKIILKLK